MHLVSSSPSSSLQHTGSGHTDEGVEGFALFVIVVTRRLFDSTARIGAEITLKLCFAISLCNISTWAFPPWVLTPSSFGDYITDSDLASLCHQYEPTTRSNHIAWRSGTERVFFVSIDSQAHILEVDHLRIPLVLLHKIKGNR
jgi:hypothetical protein